MPAQQTNAFSSHISTKPVRKFGRVLNVNPHGPLINGNQKQKSNFKLMSSQKANGHSENDEPIKSMPSSDNQSNFKMVNCKKDQNFAAIENLTRSKLQNRNKNIATCSAYIDFSFDDISVKDQINWITRQDAAENDVNYFRLLIGERYAALLETWKQNDQLKKEIDELVLENELLTEQIEHISQVKEILSSEGLLIFEEDK